MDSSFKPSTRPLPGVPEGLYRLAVAPRLVFPLYTVVAALLAWRLVAAPPPWALAAGLVALGVGTVTLLEYVIHRFALHAKGRSLHTEVHRRHHADPDNLLFAVIPLPGSAVLLSACAAVSFAVGRSPEATTAYAVGLVAGYLFHEVSHYRIHHARPRTRLGRWLADNHHVHHHRDPRRNYGFVTDAWDRALRTYQDPAGLSPRPTEPSGAAPDRSRADP